MAKFQILEAVPVIGNRIIEFCSDENDFFLQIF